MREKILDGFRKATGAEVTLAFDEAGPDFETPGDANQRNNNVYEVTIVVADSAGANETNTTRP